MTHRLWTACILLLTLSCPSVFPFAANAQPISIPFAVLQSIVLVVCDSRQGSGTVTHGADGTVLTSAHVVMNKDTGVLAKQCVVGFVDSSLGVPHIFYHATPQRWIFDQAKGQDFAFLHIDAPLDPQQTLPMPFPELSTNEFSQVNDAVDVFGYSDQDASLSIRNGRITGFSEGFIQTNVQVAPGDSGGAALDQQFHLVGVPTRVVRITSDAGVQQTRYELVDIRSVMNWLDQISPNLDEAYFHHADLTRYQEQAVFVQHADLGCDQLVRTRNQSTIFCLLPGPQRLVFPNSGTFLSWFPDFNGVQLVRPDGLAEFPIARNVTYKPGSLIKSTSTAKTYLVTDVFGTLRWIPDEATARHLWGSGWASLVHDVPDEFWSNYSVGQPLNPLT